MKTKYFLLLVFLLLIGWSCRKELGLNDDDIEVPSDFWAYNQAGKGLTASEGNVRKVLPQAIDDLRNMKHKREFENYVSKLGRPVWNESTEFTIGGKISTLLVPIINDNKKSATALLVVNYKDNYYKYHVVIRGKYPRATGKNQGKKLLPAKGWDRLFNAMDKEFYNKGKSKGFVKNSNPEDITVKDYQAMTYLGWMCWHWCDNDGYGGCIPDTEYGYECADIYDWVWYDTEDNPIASEQDYTITGGGNLVTPPESTPPATYRIPHTSNPLPPANTLNVQDRGMCAHKIIEWANRYYGGTLTAQNSLTEYMSEHSYTNRDLYEVLGVAGEHISQLINAFFYVDGNPSSEMEMMASIYVYGHPMLATIPVNGQGHEVMITGYNPAPINGVVKFEYFDPQYGIYQLAPTGQFSNIFEITGKR